MDNIRDSYNSQFAFASISGPENSKKEEKNNLEKLSLGQRMRKQTMKCSEYEKS